MSFVTLYYFRWCCVCTTLLCRIKGLCWINLGLESKKEIIWNLKGLQIAKNLLKQTNKQSWRSQFPNFKTYYKAIIIKTVWDWNKDNHWDRIESRNKSLTYKWLSIRVPRPFNEKWTVQGKLQKNEVRPLTYITYRNYLKMNQRPKCKSQNYKTLRRKYWGKASWHYIW